MYLSIQRMVMIENQIKDLNEKTAKQSLTPIHIFQRTSENLGKLVAWRT